MSEYNKPLPTPSPWSKPFWEGAKRHEFLFQQCQDCGANIFYPKEFCPKCLSDNLKWIRANGKGKVYTFSTVYMYPPSPFVNDTPYTVAVIRLDEGISLLSQIVDCKSEDIKCDMPVEVVFDDVTDEVTIPKFKPI